MMRISWSGTKRFSVDESGYTGTDLLSRCKQRRRIANRVAIPILMMSAPAVPERVQRFHSVIPDPASDDPSIMPEQMRSASGPPATKYVLGSRGSRATVSQAR
jgi:hypothetical protein